MKIKQKRIQEIIKEEMELLEKQPCRSTLIELVSIFGADVVLDEMVKHFPNDLLNETVQKLAEQMNVKNNPTLGSKVKHLW